MNRLFAGILAITATTAVRLTLHRELAQSLQEEGPPTPEEVAEAIEEKAEGDAGELAQSLQEEGPPTIAEVAEAIEGKAEGDAVELAQSPEKDAFA